MVNKLFVMAPIMFAARKLDSEDAQQVMWLRIAYGTVQTICVLVVVYTYIKATAMNGKNIGGVIYVPPAPQPFADPNAKKKYTEVNFTAHILSTARSLLGSTLFGICMTCGMHWYKGMIVGLAMQTIMGPMNLIENPLVKALLLGNGFRPEDKIFDEKTAAELTQDDEIVDENGSVVVRQTGTVAAASSGSFEDLLLDTWDAGNKADIGALMAAITKKNCNYRTKESGWTPMMILSGLGAKGAPSAIRQLKEMGGNPAIVDAEGWNCLHWAAFHGSIEAAKELVKDSALLSVKDKEGKLPLDIAQTEKNDDVAKFIESAVESASTGKGSTDTGLRKRK